jgi:hypothetical protein
VLDELYVADEGFFAYHPHSRALIHNANLLGARLVHRLLGDDPSALSAAASAVEQTLAAQREDGSWPYGADGGLGFVDSFHTGYVLECLLPFRDEHEGVDDALRRGTAYYINSFFHADGAASLWPHKRYPEDAHSAGTALTALALLARHGFAEPHLVARIGARVIGHGIRDGHAIFRRWRFGSSRVRYIRWCDAHVALGLADAASLLSGAAASTPAGARALASS